MLNDDEMAESVISGLTRQEIAYDLDTRFGISAWGAYVDAERAGLCYAVAARKAREVPNAKRLEQADYTDLKEWPRHNACDQPFVVLKVHVGPYEPGFNDSVYPECIAVCHKCGFSKWVPRVGAA